jgi:hypothetical protein
MSQRRILRSHSDQPVLLASWDVQVSYPSGVELSLSRNEGCAAGLSLTPGEELGYDRLLKQITHSEIFA